MSSIVVVGGGIAGLAAARQLATTGADVVLLERDRIGGKLRTSPFAGRDVDEGADAFLARLPWAVDLARQVGLEGDLVSPAASAAYVFIDGELHPLPTAHLLGVPTDLESVAATGVLTSAGVTAARRDLDRTDGPVVGDDVAIGPFIRDCVGDEVVDRLVGPLVGGINAGDVERLSLAAVTPQIDAAARHREPSLIRSAAAVRAAAQPVDTPLFLSPRRGMGLLADAVAADLAAHGTAIRLGEAAESIEPRDEHGGRGGWRVTTSANDEFDVDAAVLATPAHASGYLLDRIATEASQFLVDLDYASVAIVTLAVDPSDIGRPLDGSGYLVPRSAETLLTACSWASSKWAELEPERGDGTVLLRASAGRDGDDRLADLDDETLVARLVDDLAMTMDLRGQPASVRVSRWPRSFPQYRPEHLKRVAAAEADLAGRAPTIAVAGAALRGVGVPACIKSGVDAADRVLTVLARSASV